MGVQSTFENEQRAFSPFSPKTSNLLHTIQELRNPVSKRGKTMDEMLAFEASTLYYANSQSRSLASLEPQGIKPIVARDGSKFYCDSKGEIIFAMYSTGAIVSIRPESVSAMTANGDYWMVGANGQSFRVD